MTKESIFNKVSILGPVVLLAFLLSPAVTHAALLDWDTQTLAPGQKSEKKQVVPANNGGIVSETYKTDSTNAGKDVIVNIQNNNSSATWQSNAPAVSSATSNPLGAGYSGVYGEDGGTGQKSLFLCLSGNTTGITVTINFSLYSQGVKDVSFSLFDIDSRSIPDQIVNIWGTTLSGGTIAATSITGAACNQVNAEGTVGASITGTSSATENTSLGNALISFGTNTVTSVQFTYKNTDVVQNSWNGIGLGDVSYDDANTSPEVGTSLAAVAACGLAFGFQRYRKNRLKGRNEPFNAL